MKLGEQECLIWGTNAEIKKHDGFYHFKSPRAGGKYRLSIKLYEEKKENILEIEEFASDEQKSRLTSRLVDRRLEGEDAPFIDEFIIDMKYQPSDEHVPFTDDYIMDDYTANTASPPYYDKKEREIIFKNLPPPMGMQKRIDRLLFYIEHKISRSRGMPLKLDLNSDLSLEDYIGKASLAWTETTIWNDTNVLLEHLREAGYVKIRTNSLNITVEGRLRLEEIRHVSNPSQTAFVAMWFDDSMDDIYKKAIKPGIEDAGYEALRIDKKEHNNKIDDEIIAAIRKCRFLLADFTCEEGSARGGVYYEAGFAHGLNIKVIFTCHEDLMDKIHFDIRQYNTISWKENEPDKLRKDIKNRIEATLGKGTYKPVSTS